MVKHLHCLVFFLSFSVIFYCGTSIAQSKKDKAPVKVASPKNLNPVEMEKAGLQIVDSEKDSAKEKEKEGEYYNLVVLINPATGADNLFAEVTRLLPGIEIHSSTTSPQARVIRSRNMLLPLFQKAYGGAFHIFSESDLEVYSQTIPAFAQFREEVLNLTSQLSK